jgi:hypothetical protein
VLPEYCSKKPPSASAATELGEYDCTVPTPVNSTTVPGTTPLPRMLVGCRTQVVKEVGLSVKVVVGVGVGVGAAVGAGVQSTT